MKKIILTASVLLTLFACQNTEENTVTETSKTSQAMRKTNQMENFRQAITEINKPQYAPSKEYIEKNGAELSNERKEVLLQPAKDLLMATGVSAAQLKKETTNDILNKAFKIYVSQTAYQPTK